MTKTEELMSILTAFRFLAMLMMLLLAVMSHHGILIDSVTAGFINNFLAGFIGINTIGKIKDAFLKANNIDTKPIENIVPSCINCTSADDEIGRYENEELEKQI